MEVNRTGCIINMGVEKAELLPKKKKGGGGGEGFIIKFLQSSTIE